MHATAPASPAELAETTSQQLWPLTPAAFTIEGVGLVDEMPVEAFGSDPSASSVSDPDDAPAFRDRERGATERSVAPARVTGDFLCAHILDVEKTPEWPTMDIPVLLARNVLPAQTPPISSKIAAGRADVPGSRQASPATLLAEPFSDFNAVKPAARIDLSGPPPPDPADCPTAGVPHTVFVDGSIIRATEGGEWVRRFIKQNRKHPAVRLYGPNGRCVHWSAAEIYEQTELWFASASADMAAFAKHGGNHRSSTPTLIVPDRCHLGGGKYIWDLREFRRAQAAGLDTSRIAITALDVDLAIAPKLQADRLRERFAAAGVTDEFVMQQMLESGLVSSSRAPRHTILQLNYPPVARHLRFARDLVRREATERKLSSPFAAGVPLFPVRLNPYGAVERDGKDARLCCDLSSPQRQEDGAGSLSINAGIPFHDKLLLAEMKLTSAQAFARDVGVLRADDALRDKVWIATTDWTAYYRNLLKPVAEWWTQLLWLDPAGPQIDLATCFGDAGAPAQSNRVQDVLLELIAFEFEKRLIKMRSDPTAAETMAAVDAWTAARSAALQRRFPARFASAAAGDVLAGIWVARQRRIASLHGFFDDSLLASFVTTVTEQTADGVYVRTRTTGPLAELISALLDVASDIGLPVAAHKIACGSPDGRTGRLDLDHWKATGEVCWFLEPGSMVALGKEIDLETSSIRDTEARVVKLGLEIDQLCSGTGSQTDDFSVLLSDLRTVIGKGMFVLQTEPHLQPVMNNPVRSLKLSSLLAARVPQRLRGKQVPLHRKAKFGAVSSRSRTRFPKAAQADLKQLALGILPRTGLPFNPVVSSIGSGTRNACWILEDASGQLGGGGGAVFLDPLEPDSVLWSYDEFTPAEIEHHSTFLEGLNANRNLRRAAEQGYSDVIEILDNSSWVAVARTGRASDPTLQALLADRQRIRAQFPDVCVYSLWQPREKGTIADAVSKLNLVYQGADLPNLPVLRPITGRDWAHAALLEAGFVGGLCPDGRIQ